MMVKKCNFDEIKHLIGLGKKERVTFDNNEKCTWFCYEEQGNIIGCVCAVDNGKSYRYKSDFVLKEHRGKGIYSKMFEHRLMCFKDKNITAFCTEMSLPMYLKNGFVVKNYNKYGIAFVERKGE